MKLKNLPSIFPLSHSTDNTLRATDQIQIASQRQQRRHRIQHAFLSYCQLFSGVLDNTDTKFTKNHTALCHNRLTGMPCNSGCVRYGMDCHWQHGTWLFQAHNVRYIRYQYDIFHCFAYHYTKTHHTSYQRRDGRRYLSIRPLCFVKL